MPSLRQHPLFCALLYSGLCLTIVQLAPTEQWARTTDESNPVVGENIPPDYQGSNLFEGDIMLSEDQFEAIREKVLDTHDFKRSVDQAGTTPLTSTAPQNENIWPNARIPYNFHPLLRSTWRRKFMTAMQMIEEDTCIRFFLSTPSDTDYLLYEHSDKCMSYVGRHGGAQPVTIGDRCSSPGHAIHEIGHALGLWHEHSRPDRDNYIEILYSNLQSPLYQVYFLKTSQELFKSVPDVGYDIQSVMHYSPVAFASTAGGVGRPTIIVKADADLDELNCINRLPMGQRSQLSYKDTLRLNLLYGCSDNVTNSVVEPPCIIPTPTTSMLLPSTIPIPSITIPAYTPTPLSPRLKTGNVIALTIGQGSYGMECVFSPGCTPIPCDRNRCTGISTAVSNQFYIINHRSSVNKILSGGTVLLRSVNSPTLWLDCSDPTSCTITTCGEDIVDDLSDFANISYKSSCEKHQFQVYGVGRPLNKLLSVRHKLQFRDKTQQSYVSCNGKRCRLLEIGSCQSIPVFPVERIYDKCPIEYFSVDKLAEF